MHPKHRQIIEAMQAGASLVQEIHGGCLVGYTLRKWNTPNVEISESVYYKMRELEYIEPDRREFYSKHIVLHHNRLTSKYRTMP